MARVWLEAGRMDILLQDLRYALRGLARNPGFAVAALLTFGIGTGANATVFGFVNALLLRPAPVVSDPSSLYSVFTSDFSSGPYGASSYPDYLSLRSEASAFSALAAFDESAAVLRYGDTTERIRGMEVSGEFFELLGLRPAHGRLLSAADTSPGATAVAVISHDVWQRLFGMTADVLGSTVWINGQPHTVVGVAPAKFEGLNLGGSFQVWTPLVAKASDPAARGNRGLSLVARLRADSSVREAQAQLDAIAVNLAREYPATNMGTLRHPKDPRPMVVLQHSRMHPSFRGMVAMIGAVLMSAVALVLLVACANVAGLLLSRAAARSREITTRLALGASKSRLLRQLLTESLLISIGGGALGVLFALWTADVLPSFFPAEQQRLLDVTIDMRVVAFTALLSIGAGALFGLLPALHVLRPSAQSFLRNESTRASDSRTGFVRAGLVLAQVALTFVLLVSCGLLARSLSNALSADLGFGTRDAVVASLEVPAGELTPEQGAIYFEQTLERVRALPGVEAASLAQSLPVSGRSRRGFRIDGYEPRPGEDMELNVNVVEPRYFEAMRIPVLDGRAFDGRDAATGPRVVIVNDVLAQRYFGGRAVGRRMLDGRGVVSFEIVGVVRSGKQRSVQEAPLPVVFFPLSQSYTPRMSLVARTATDPGAHTDRIRAAVQEVNRSVAVFRVMTLAGHLSEALGAERLTTTLVTASGSMALLLAIVGLYGVIAYGVVRRRKEIGVRIALGAQPLDVVRLVVAEGLRVTFLGIACGVAGALAATRLLASMLYGVGPWDLASFAGAGLLLGTIAALAAWAPAQRAVRLDPVTVLRQE